MKMHGRPPKNPNESRFHEKPLYKLLLERLPEKFNKNGKLDLIRLAKDGDVSRYTVYRWMNDEAMAARSAKQIIKLSEGTISQVDMIPYLLRD